MALLALLLLALVPIAAWRWFRTRAPRHLWFATGVAFGLVVSPLSLGLYSTFFLSPLGLPTGLLGLMSSLFHGEPGYQVSIWLGLVPSHEVVTGIGHLYVELVTGLIWAPLYGVVGALIDWVRIARSRQSA